MLKKLFSLLLAPFLLLLLVGCEVPNPATEDVIPTNWGRSLIPTHRDVPYVDNAYGGCPGWGSDGSCSGSQTLDIYPSTSGNKKGTLVFLHSGGFVEGDKFPMTDMGVFLRLTQRGWGIVSVNYRLASNTNFLFPAAIQDVNAALRWVQVNGNQYGLFNEKLVVVGYSAGGTLAMLAGVGGNSGRQEFGASVPLSGWVSLAGIANFQAGDFSRFWGKLWMGENRFNQFWQVASPLTWLDPQDPQGYLVHGNLDVFVEYTNSVQVHSRLPDKLFFDSVDFWADGSLIPESRRGHLPTAGMNAKEFEKWLDSLPTLHAVSNPFGNIDAVTASSKTVRLQGWVLDPNTPSSVDVHVYMNGVYVSQGKANVARGDIAQAYPLHGPEHGYDISITTKSGVQKVCVYAINISLGNSNPLIGCRNVVVP